MTTRKSYEVAEFKALPDSNGTKGRFEALVSVFGNVDLQGDRVVPGAFKGSIDKWREKGDPVPTIWAHDWANPHAHIGSIDPAKMEETDQGLKVEGSIDLDNPFAAQVYRLLKERRVKEFSFAYDILKERTARDKANELVELDIIEAGPTLKGANPDTELLAVKSALESAAKEASGDEREEKIRQAMSLLKEVLTSEEVEAPPDDEETESDDPVEAKDEEPDEAKSEEPTEVEPRLLPELVVAEIEEALSS